MMGNHLRQFSPLACTIYPCMIINIFVTICLHQLIKVQFKRKAVRVTSRFTIATLGLTWFKVIHIGQLHENSRGKFFSLSKLFLYDNFLCKSLIDGSSASCLALTVGNAT